MAEIKPNQLRYNTKGDYWYITGNVVGYLAYGTHITKYGFLMPIIAHKKTFEADEVVLDLNVKEKEDGCIKS